MFVLACLTICGYLLIVNRFVVFDSTRDGVMTSEMIHGERVTVETVRTPHDIELGLSGRRRIPRDYVMRFVFDSPAIRPFWMQGMWVPLEITWFRDGRVVDRARLSPPRFPWSTPESYTPRASADMVEERLDP